jgi:hypothetical protein
MMKKRALKALYISPNMLVGKAGEAQLTFGIQTNGTVSS